MIRRSADKETVAKTVAYWKADADLAGIRDAEALAKLPDEERAAFAKLWADVDALIAEVAGEGPKSGPR